MQMLPDSMQSFTPLVQGVAQSNALITVSQNGYTIYQKEVPPGPFTIADLQLSGSGSDLDVSIKEADGSVRSFGALLFRAQYAATWCFKFRFYRRTQSDIWCQESGGLSRGKLYIWPQQSFDTLWRYDFIRKL